MGNGNEQVSKASKTEPPRVVILQQPTPNHNEVTGPQPVKTQLHSLEEQIRAIEGTTSQRLEASDFCLIPNVILSPDFKVPKFEKYKGSSYPRVHLAMYCRKMAAYNY